MSERRPHCWLTLTLAAAILACSAPVHARSASSSTTRRGRRGLSRLPRVALRTRGGARDEGEDAAAEEAGDADADEYDLVVIGGGSGGLACAQEAARLGMRVAVCDFVEPSPAGTTWGLGGTCVNVGCIPKKLMHQAALLGEALHDAPSFGWEARRGEAEAEPPSHAWETLVTNVQMHIKSLNFGYRSALMSADVEYVNARASFVDARTVECADAAGETRRLRAKSFVIAVGGRPRYLDDIPGGRDLVVSSDDLFSLPAAPGKTLCIGGGYVSLECAGFLNGLGMEADVMVRSIPLRGFDQQMATLVKEHMSERGCYFVDGAVPTSVERVPAAEGGGRERRRVTWRFADGSEGEGVYDTVLVAVGRDAQTARLGLENTLVRTNPRTGKVLADGERTHAGHIHAIGDVLDGKPELTPVAIQAGVRLARRLAGVASEEMDYAGVPTTVFTPLEYSCVGLSEEDAIEAHGEVCRARAVRRRSRAPRAAEPCVS